jgi:hypothetical protein
MLALGIIKPTPARPEFVGEGKPHGLIRTVVEAQEGERNARLYWAARRAVDDGLNPEILRAAARSVGLDDREISRTPASGTRRVAA